MMNEATNQSNAAAAPVVDEQVRREAEKIAGSIASLLPQKVPFTRTDAFGFVVEGILRYAASRHDRIAKLEAFKAYVHKRLDDAGVQVDPESSYKAEGCRIGGRLDIVLAAAHPPAADSIDAKLVNRIQELKEQRLLEARESKGALIESHRCESYCRAIRDVLALFQVGVPPTAPAAAKEAEWPVYDMHKARTAAFDEEVKRTPSVIAAVAAAPSAEQAKTGEGWYSVYNEWAQQHQAVSTYATRHLAKLIWDARGEQEAKYSQAVKDFANSANVEYEPASAPSAVQAEPIPSGVYFGFDGGNFYSMDGHHGMGVAFWEKWKKRKHEFPTGDMHSVFSPPASAPIPASTPSDEAMQHRMASSPTPVADNWCNAIVEGVNEEVFYRCTKPAGHAGDHADEDGKYSTAWRYVPSTANRSAAPIAAEGKAEKPRWSHGCNECEFLGRFGEFDLYYCHDGNPAPWSAVTVRKDGRSEISGHDATYHPAIAEARKRMAAKHRQPPSLPQAEAAEQPRLHRDGALIEKIAGEVWNSPDICNRDKLNEVVERYIVAVSKPAETADQPSVAASQAETLK